MKDSYEQGGKKFAEGTGRILSRDVFLNLLDLEVKRSRRYQNFFCILVMRLNQLSNRDNGTHQDSCYQKLTHLLEEELRESDILGLLDDNCIGAILPYGDGVAGDITRSRFEGNLKYCNFQQEGYEVTIRRVCFPIDGTDTVEIIKKVKSIGEA